MAIVSFAHRNFLKMKLNVFAMRQFKNLIQLQKYAYAILLVCLLTDKHVLIHARQTLFRIHQISIALINAYRIVKHA